MRKVIIALIFGFLFCFTPSWSMTPSSDPEQKQQPELDAKLQFGNGKLGFTFIIFTDWFCPACHLFEPKLKELLPFLESKGKVWFVDFPLDRNTLRYTPYNLGFMTFNKERYLDLRMLMSNLTRKEKTPTDAIIQEALQNFGIEFKKLDAESIEKGMANFQAITQFYQIRQVPTLLILSPSLNKEDRIIGYKKMTQENIIQVIEKMGKS